MMSETSFVTNIDEKKTPKMRKSERDVMCLKCAARRTTGASTFSRLKPSSTVSIIRSVPSVRQSIDEMSRADGGVITSETMAASTESVSMGSLFKYSRALVMACASFRRLFRWPFRRLFRRLSGPESIYHKRQKGKRENVFCASLYFRISGGSFPAHKAAHAFDR